MSPTDPPTPSSPTLYFAFGSNLWLHQMSLRCPLSQYLGLARLSSYRWIINERGYANVVEITDGPNTSTTLADNHDYSREVWGMVYSLLPSDEAALDKNEGVPHAYTKHYLPTDFWALEHPIAPPRVSTDPYPPAIDVSNPPSESVKMLVYVDLKRVSASTPREEYVYRMNRGIDDMVRCGVPEEYVEGVLRGYIPSDDDKQEEGGEDAVGDFAKKQAQGFRDESGIF